MTFQKLKKLTLKNFEGLELKVDTMFLMDMFEMVFNKFDFSVQNVAYKTNPLDTTNISHNKP